VDLGGRRENFTTEAQSTQRPEVRIGFGWKLISAPSLISAPLRPYADTPLRRYADTPKAPLRPYAPTLRGKRRYADTSKSRYAGRPLRRHGFIPWPGHPEKGGGQHSDTRHRKIQRALQGAGGAQVKHPDPDCRENHQGPAEPSIGRLPKD